MNEVQLILEVTDKMGETLAKDLASLERSHGPGIAHSVAGNLAVDLMVTVISAVPNAKRVDVMRGMLMALSENLRGELAAQDADQVIAKAMEKARGA